MHWTPTLNSVSSLIAFELTYKNVHRVKEYCIYQDLRVNSENEQKKKIVHIKCIPLQNGKSTLYKINFKVDIFFNFQN